GRRPGDDRGQRRGPSRGGDRRPGGDRGRVRRQPRRPSRRLCGRKPDPGDPAGGGEAGERRWGKGAKRLGPVGSRWGLRPLFRRGAGPVLGRGPSGGPLRDIGGSPFNASSLQCSTPGRFAEGTFYDGKAPWFSHGLFWEATDCGES